jgi:hypothetical protein
VEVELWEEVVEEGRGRGGQRNQEKCETTCVCMFVSVCVCPERGKYRGEEKEQKDEPAKQRTSPFLVFYSQKFHSFSAAAIVAVVVILIIVLLIHTHIHPCMYECWSWGKGA